MTNKQLRAFLDDQEMESKEVVTLEGLDKLGKKRLQVNMANTTAKSRMESLFSDWHLLLANQSLKWITSKNQKNAMAHVIFAINTLSRAKD